MGNCCKIKLDFDLDADVFTTLFLVHSRREKTAGD